MVDRPAPVLAAGNGALWREVVARTRAALASGALAPIATDESVVEDAGIPFLLRKASSLAGKPRSAPTAVGSDKAPRNPFLPFEPALFVAELSPTHVALLNKFPVIDHHLLIVTRAFADQEDWLDRDDFAALAGCLAEIDGLGFYNGGTVAGASQPHKHLQLVPLPLGTAIDGLPIDVVTKPTQGMAGAVTLTGLGFAHAMRWLPGIDWRDHAAAATSLVTVYADLLAATGVASPSGPAGPRQSAPYNLLVTRQWMLLVPRRQERFGTVSVNALGFAGAFFVRNDDEFAAVRAAGPLAVLRAVAR